MTDINWHNRTRNWLLSVIRQREYLNRSGKTKVAHLTNMEYCSKLLQYIQVNKYQSNEMMAKFVISHQSEIESILPGSGSVAHESRYKQFYKLLADSTSIIRISVAYKTYEQQCN